MTTRTEMQIEIADAFTNLLKMAVAAEHFEQVGDDKALERADEQYAGLELLAFDIAAKYGWDWEQDDEWCPEHMTGTEIAHYGLSRAMEKCKVSR